MVDKKAILAIVGVPATQRYDTYLGLPALVGKSRTAAFKGILDPAVIQAIPSYCMGIFLLPNDLCSDINSQMRKFWWGHQENGTRINWMSWGKMGMAKASGGMGFRNLNLFNRALLAKQSWRLWKEPESLVVKIMKAKYYPDGSILDAKVGAKPSFAWRSIHSSCDVLKEDLFWRIGNGATV
ncbi:uncharacterized mitochondrial protein AtMg00310-like [Corylus avellana]|uniref:uncharacterized mitochondrial protein AtMg00310-like n=1 Tax=Corylus avellana TaxID=13451 RepID=UPI00286C6897|nr:uncharacterized mitochondrial protein AtMg00310-like [Corylus avellana]